MNNRMIGHFVDFLMAKIDKKMNLEKPVIFFCNFQKVLSSNRLPEFHLFIIIIISLHFGRKDTGDQKSK